MKINGIYFIRVKQAMIKVRYRTRRKLEDYKITFNVSTVKSGETIPVDALTSKLYFNWTEYYLIYSYWSAI
jgi:hypothetical protein